MPETATLALIADAYIPLLALLSAAVVVTGLFKGQWKLGRARLLSIAVMTLTVYGLMILDSQLGVWPAFGLDYSTHTALSLGLVIFLCLHAPRGVVAWTASFLAYAALMRYLQYHTLADIVTTGAVAGGVTILSMSLLRRQVA